jgi:hypothetical protein
VAVFGGDDRRIGLMQGEAWRARIHAARSDLAAIEAFRLQQPRAVPYALYRWLAERRAGRYLGQALAASPGWLERLDGIAHGAGLAPRSIHLFNALEPLLSSVAGCTALPQACTAIAIRGRRSASGEPVIARNFDYLPLVQPYHAMRELRPTRGYRSIDFTTVPMAGAIDGVNEAGLAIAYNYAFAIDEDDRPAPPVSMLIAHALRHCASVQAAIDWIGGQPRCGAALLMLADAQGDIAALELSSTRCAVRRPAAGEDLLCHSNAFSTVRMREVEAPVDARYDDRAPTPLRGERLHESSELRDARLAVLLGRDQALSDADLLAVLADHGDSRVPGECTLCVHGSYWRTTACLQLYPARRSLRYAFDTACNALFDEHAL